MEKRASSLEEHMGIVGSAHEKTAGVSGDNNDLLSRLADELELPGQEKVANAPVAEGEVAPADASVAGAAEPVVASTEGVTAPQVAIAGGNLEEAAAGEVPAATKPNEGVAISAGDGKVIDANSMHRTPEAVAAAADGNQGVGGDEANAAAISPDGASAGLSQEKTAEAVEIGKVIADSFQAQIEKTASERQYSEAVGILKEAGILEGYTMNDEGMDKTASETPVDCLTKIANREDLSHAEVIGAAHEYIELEKQASEAEAAGRADAKAAVAEQMEKEAEETEKVAALLKDPEVVAATKVLKAKGVIK